MMKMSKIYIKAAVWIPSNMADMAEIRRLADVFLG